MQFFFTWVKDKNAPLIHDIISFHLVHETGHFPNLFIKCMGANGSFPTAGEKAIFGVTINGLKHILFIGFLVQAPSFMDEKVTCYTLSAKTTEGIEEFKKGLEDIKKSPYWDPLFCDFMVHDSPREILDAVSILPHWSRKGEFCFTDILVSPNILDITAKTFKFSMKPFKVPIDEVLIALETQWHQSYRGITKILENVRIKTLMGERLQKEWFKAPLSLKGSGYELLASELKQVNSTEYVPEVKVQWNYIQKREEVCRFSLKRKNPSALNRVFDLKIQLHDVVRDYKTSYWIPNASYEKGHKVYYRGGLYRARESHSQLYSFQKDLWEEIAPQDNLPPYSSSFFTTERGHKSLDHAFEIALCYLKSSSRYALAEAHVPLEDALDISCHMMIVLDNPKLLGKRLCGKIERYEFCFDEEKNFPYVKIFFSLSHHDFPVSEKGPEGMRFTPSGIGYFPVYDQKPCYGIVDPLTVCGHDLVEKVEITHDAEAQEKEMRPTHVKVVLKDLSSHEALRHEISL